MMKQIYKVIWSVYIYKYKKVYEIQCSNLECQQKAEEYSSLPKLKCFDLLNVCFKLTF